MNMSRDPFEDAFIKNLISVGLGIIITYINGIFVFVFCRTSIFYTDPRYILYIHLVINDMIMLFLSVTLQVVVYTVPLVNVTVCCFLIFWSFVTSDNTALNLVGMALERYIAVCKPLHHPQICTVKRTYICISLIWLLTIVIALTDIIIALVKQPIGFFMTSIVCYSKNIYNSNEYLIKSIFKQSIYLSSVWITLVFTYFKVFRAANAATIDKVIARKAQNTILLHGIQLILCMISYITPVMTYIFLELFPKYRSTFMFTFYIISNVIPRLLSPLIYGVRDQKMFMYVRTYLTFRQCSKKINQHAVNQCLSTSLHQAK